MIQSKTNPAHRLDGNREIVTVFDGAPLMLARMKPGETLEDAQLRANPDQWLVIDRQGSGAAGAWTPNKPNRQLPAVASIRLLCKFYSKSPLTSAIKARPR